jgi:hypothetical protein
VEALPVLQAPLHHLQHSSHSNSSSFTCYTSANISMAGQSRAERGNSVHTGLKPQRESIRASLLPHFQLPPPPPVWAAVTSVATPQPWVGGAAYHDCLCNQTGLREPDQFCISDEKHTSAVRWMRFPRGAVLKLFCTRDLALPRISYL